MITEPCDRPPGVLRSSVSFSLPVSALACLRGCRHAVCVSWRVKYMGIGSGVCVCTWTSLCLFLQANKLRCNKTTISLEQGAARQKFTQQILLRISMLGSLDFQRLGFRSRACMELFSLKSSTSTFPTVCDVSLLLGFFRISPLHKINFSFLSRKTPCEFK